MHGNLLFYFCPSVQEFIVILFLSVISHPIAYKSFLKNAKFLDGTLKTLEI